MNIAESDPTVVRPTMKERQRQLRENAILDAAVEFIQTKGFNAMTLEDITEAIGISRPTLYQHFSSKEDVLIHVAMRNLRTSRDMLDAMDPARPAAERLEEFVRWCINRRFGVNRQPFYDMTRLVLSCGGTDPRLLEPQLEFMGQLTKLTEEAQATGGVRQDIRAMIIAESIVGIFKHLAFDRLIEGGHTNSTEITDSILKMFFTAS